MVYAERRHSDLSGNGLYELAAILRAKGALAEPLQPAYSCDANTMVCEWPTHH